MREIEAAGGIVHWLQSADGMLLRAAEFGAGRRVMLLFNGRGEFIERYLPTIAALNRRGFKVWTMDWRGQGFSQRMLADPLLHHVVRFEDYLADAALLLERHVRPDLAGRPLLLMAHSMGGHLAARLLALRQDAFAGAVLLAPMVDFVRSKLLPGWAARGIAELACLIPGMGERPGPGTNPTPMLDRPFSENRLTHDEALYLADIAFQRAHPGVQIGPSTWSWLRAALRSISVLADPGFARGLALPMLVCVAGADEIVDSAAVRRFASALPQGEIVDFPGARHDLLREERSFNGALWPAIDGFLAKNFGETRDG
jgi:lysophospholipase